MPQETLEEKIARVLKDEVHLSDYDPQWATLFEEEKAFLEQTIPELLSGRIEHFGSTAVPGLTAKPIVDMLIEITSAEQVNDTVPAIFEPLGYDYFWRPLNDGSGKHYPWLIKRGNHGQRTHHLHMVEANSPLWDRLLFRDYLCTHPEVAQAYNELKQELTEQFPNDRIAYTKGKTEFVYSIMDKARGKNN